MGTGLGAQELAGDLEISTFGDLQYSTVRKLRKKTLSLFPIKSSFLGSSRLGEALLVSRTFRLAVLTLLKLGSALRGV